MREILEVQMLRYSKIMLGNCCNIRSSLPSSIMSCHQWVIRSPDWPNHSFLTTKLFSPTLPLHSLLASPPVSHGRPNFRSCPRSHQHWTLPKFRPSGHRSHPRPNQSKWYSTVVKIPLTQQVILFLDVYYRVYISSLVLIRSVDRQAVKLGELSNSSGSISLHNEESDFWLESKPGRIIGIEENRTSDLHIV